MAAVERDHAMEAFAQSLALLDEADAYEAARTRLQAGIARLSHEPSEQAIALLRKAQATFQELGAQRDLIALDESVRGYW
jgi:hypothetical protein